MAVGRIVTLVVTLALSAACGGDSSECDALLDEMWRAREQLQSTLLSVKAASGPGGSAITAAESDELERQTKATAATFNTADAAGCLDPLRESS